MSPAHSSTLCTFSASSSSMIRAVGPEMEMAAIIFPFALYTGAAMAQFPAARARVIAGTGHWLHAEKPVLFNKLVVDFLSTGG